ncbi:dihydropteroate synthase [Hornefia butyriciproducens]|uniref:dihydropteroate synthase n=1 Tax=Hornefia butyriciproducens TaxID=2652293 RepID=UPI003CFF0A91
MKHFLLKNGERKEFAHMEMMGIINVTPDSFFAGSRTAETQVAVERADRLIQEGASFIDLGGESTRPGAEKVEVREEIDRVCPVIEIIRRKHPEILLSVDTYNAETAEAAVAAGVDIINDISGLTFDENMAAVAAKAGVPVILMHTGGRPDVMQKDPHYDDVVQEVYDYLQRQINYAVASGISREKIIIDLGIGFGKTFEHNMTLLRNIDRFADLNCPQLLAVSRKTFIGALLDEKDPADRLYGTIAVTLYGQLHGIEMARVHDVKENCDAVRMMEALR